MQYISDVHLDVDDVFTLVKAPGAKYLALCGDIAQFDDETLYVKLRKWSKMYEKILYIPGNHEYFYGQMKKLIEIFKKRKPLNVILFDRERIELDGIIYLGCTLWAKVPIEHSAYVSKRIRDYSAIYSGVDWEGVPLLLTVEDTNKLHDMDVRWLGNAIKKVEDENKEAVENKQELKQVVVLTHHAPFTVGTSPPRFKGVDLFGFCTDMSELFKHHITHWIFGHTHHPCNIKIKQTRLLSNPRGYPSELIKMNPKLINQNPK